MRRKFTMSGISIRLAGVKFGKINTMNVGIRMRNASNDIGETTTLKGRAKGEAIGHLGR